MNRIERFRAEQKNRDFPAALVLKQENMRYLTGYTGEGALFITQAEAVIITDFRYIEQVGMQAPEMTVERTQFERKMEDVLREYMQRASISRLALETDFMTVDQYEGIKAALEGVELVSLKRIPESMRQIKDDREMALIRSAADIACEAFSELLTWVAPGMTEKEIQIRLDYAMLKKGAECVAFDTIACAGKNGALPHAVPSDRPIEKGELLTLDFGAQVEGYKCDMTRTIAIGEVSDELRAIYDTVLKAQQAALSAIRPGVSCADIDKIARDIIDQVYPGAFGHSLGHGVGLNVHEGPNFSRVSTATVMPGHVLTVEPGVYIPGLGGCRIEDMTLITEDGYINPITAPKELIVV